MKTLLAALFLLCSTAHDFFISILTIRFAPTTHTLDLTWRITAHDIEHALENVAPLKLGSEQEHPKADSILNAYFMEHLHAVRDGRWKLHVARDGRSTPRTGRRRRQRAGAGPGRPSSGDDPAAR